MIGKRSKWNSHLCSLIKKKKKQEAERTLFVRPIRILIYLKGEIIWYYKVAITKMLEQVDNFCCCNFKNWSCSLNTCNRIGLQWRTYQFNGLAFFKVEFRLQQAVFHIQIIQRSVQYDTDRSFMSVKDFQNMYLLHYISTVILMFS